MSAQNAQLRTYETICITKVDTTDDVYQAMVERCKSAIEKEGQGKWLFSDDWGKAKIAYKIIKDNRGRWTYFRYTSTGAGVDELQRGLKINENVLRSLTTRAQEDGKDYESLRQTMATDLQEREHRRDWREDRGRNRDRGGYQRGSYNRQDSSESSEDFGDDMDIESSEG